MTNEEAIRVLNVAKAECEWNAPLEYQEAFDAAIEALGKQILKKPKAPIGTCVCPVCGRDVEIDWSDE